MKKHKKKKHNDLSGSMLNQSNDFNNFDGMLNGQSSLAFNQASGFQHRNMNKMPHNNTNQSILPSGVNKGQNLNKQMLLSGQLNDDPFSELNFSAGTNISLAIL